MRLSEARTMKIDGARVRELRERLFLTQEELAERAGMTKSTINRLENDLQSPRISSIRKLAAALGVEPSELVRK